MTPLQALQSATTVAAEMLGMDSRAGAIQPGLEADLLVVERNPLEQIRTLDDPLLVMSNGRIVMNRLSFGRGNSETNRTAGTVARGSSQSPNTLLQLQARALGEGPPVVLLGGGLLGADGWGRVPQTLAATHRVINLQSIAVQYGLEDRPLPAEYSIQTEVDALRRTLGETALDMST